MAQIYVDSKLVKPKSIHIWNSSAQLWEEDRVGYVRVNGEWVPFIEYIKWIFKSNGMENYRFLRERGVVNVSRADYMSINSTASNDHSSSVGGIVSGDNVDLTNYSKLVVDWEHTKNGNATDAPRSAFFVRVPGYDPGTESNPSKNAAASFLIQQEGRYLSELDVTSLSGDFSIHISNSPGSFFGNAGWIVYVYNIWIE